MSLKVTKDNFAAVAKALKELASKQCLVGVPADHADRKPDPEEQEPINNAAIGYIMENGSPARNIPARPHLKPGIEAAKDAIAERYKTGAQAVLDGRITDTTKIHQAVGLIAENSVKAKITDGDFTPLAPRTVQARKARGRTSEKPLIDTGQYRNSITHVVRPK